MGRWIAIFLVTLVVSAGLARVLNTHSFTSAFSFFMGTTYKEKDDPPQGAPRESQQQLHDQNEKNRDRIEDQQEKLRDQMERMKDRMNRGRD